VISLRHNSGARFSIAGGALIILLAAIAFSKRSGASLAAHPEDAPVADTVNV